MGLMFNAAPHANGSHLSWDTPPLPHPGKPLPQITSPSVPDSLQCLPHSRLEAPGGPGPLGGSRPLVHGLELLVQVKLGHNQGSLLRPSTASPIGPQQATIEDQYAHPSETQHPICKIIRPRTDSGSIFLRGREQSPLAPATFPHLPHVSVGFSAKNRGCPV